MSRTDSGISNGFGFTITASGQVQSFYGSAGLTISTSYQSVPLKQWVHLAAVTTVSSKTVALYLNGVSIPFSQSGSITTMTQSGNLNIGASGTPNGYFDGYISEARVWSAARTQQQIQDNMAINCVGNETNLVALFQGNGNFNDLTSNANNLTATGGAIATQANNPYNAIEYAVVTKVAYSAPNTTLTLFTGNAGTIPNQTLNSPQYSTSRAPYGFPAGRDSWKVVSIYKIQTYQASPANGTWYNFSTQISIPTGSWDTSYQAAIFTQGNTGSNNFNMTGYATLSTTNNAESDSEFTTYNVVQAYASANEVIGAGTVNRRKTITLNSQTTEYLNYRTSSFGTPTNAGFDGIDSATVITAECAYL
jgi:hypothetical protein